MLPGVHAGELNFKLIDSTRCLHLSLQTDIDVFSPKYRHFSDLADELRRQGNPGYMVFGLYDETARADVAGLALCRYEYDKAPATGAEQPDGFSCTKDSQPSVANLHFRTIGRYGAFASSFACRQKCPKNSTPTLYDTTSEHSDHGRQVRKDLALMHKSCKAKHPQ